MKRMFTLLSIAGLSLALSAGLFAQGAGPKGAKPGQVKPGQQQRQRGQGGGMVRNQKAMQEMYAKLNLTADQKKKIDALQKSTQAKIEALRKQNAGKPQTDRRAMMQKFRPIMEAHQKSLKAILTDAQEKKLQALMQEARAKRQQQRGTRPGAAKPGATKPGATKPGTNKTGAKGGK